jgi:hypothetical protein
VGVLLLLLQLHRPMHSPRVVAAVASMVDDMKDALAACVWVVLAGLAAASIAQWGITPW